MFEAFIERNARIARSNQVLIALRLFFATVSLAVLILGEPKVLTTPQGDTPLYFRPPGFLTLIVLVLTIAYLLLVRVVRDKPRVAAQLAAIQIFVDILLITGLIWKTGGVDSEFAMLYLISICSAGFVLKWNASIVAAIVSSILYSGVAIAYSVSIVPEEIRADPQKLESVRHALTGLSFIRFLLLPIFVFVLVGVIAGAISRRLVAARLMRDDILEGIGKGILMLDSRRRIVYHNREFTRLLGIDPKLVTTGLTRILGEAIDKQAQEVLASNVSAKTEIAHKRPDGKTIPIMVRINPIAEHDGSEPHGLIIALDDITVEKKMAEFAKQRQRIETMGHISATIAHEIRNPLASIRGAVQEIVRALELPENKKILLEIVLSESDRLDQIITDFLHFARMRPPGLVKTDMKRVLSDVRYLLTSRPESRDVQITVGGETGEPIAVDPEQLRQLLLNLGLNALQAMEGCSRKTAAHQRPARHAHAAGQRLRLVAPGGPLRPSGGDRFRRRFWSGEDAGGAAAGLRAVFHHETGRHGTGPGNSRAHRQRARRHDRGGERGRARNDDPNLAAGGFKGGRGDGRSDSGGGALAKRRIGQGDRET